MRDRPTARIQATCSGGMFMYRKFHAFRFGLVPALVAIMGFFVAGCSDNPVSSTTSATADGDVATSLASAVGENDGGAADQIGDMSEFLAPAAVGKIAVGDSGLSNLGWCDQYLDHSGSARARPCPPDNTMRMSHAPIIFATAISSATRCSTGRTEPILLTVCSSIS